MKPIDKAVKEKIIGLSKEGKDHYIIKSLKDSIYTLMHVITSVYIVITSVYIVITSVYIVMHDIYIEVRAIDRL